MKNELAIYGAGGFGREVAVMISQINAVDPTWKLLGFFDDYKPVEELVDGLPVLGDIDSLNRHSADLSVIVAVADPAVRTSLVGRIINKKITYPILIHPSSNLGDPARNKIGEGSIITAGVILTTGISVGKFCILNLSTTIGHDVTLEDYCTVMPACSISGNVRLGEGSLMGTGSRIIQGITIGARCIIGAGSVVTKSFGSYLKLLGVPARKRINHVERI